MYTFLPMILLVVTMLLGFGTEGSSLAAASASWESTLAKAKEEGSVIVYGPGNEGLRRSMTKPFEDRYGIKVQYEGGRGSSQRAKITNQRAAGLYQADVWISGFGSIEGIDPADLFDPLEPALLLPDVKDPKNWLNGFLWHDPNDRRFLAHSSRLFGGIAVHPDRVKPDEVTSLQDLLKPKYKGQIVSDDPRVPGVGQGLFTYLYMGKEFGFGPGYIKRLLEEQSPVLTRNGRQAADWVAQGRYLLWPAPGQRDVMELKLRGVPLEHRCLRDGQWLSVGGGGVGLINQAPHPNSAVIYLNWLLGPEGQQLFSKDGDTASRRIDVASEIASCFVPQAGTDYFWVDKREALDTRKPSGELRKFLKSILN